MAKSPTQKLEDANIRSLDFYTGEQVTGYLYGDMTRAELARELKRRRKELDQAIRGIDKMLGILPTCPITVPQV